MQEASRRNSLDDNLLGSDRPLNEPVANAFADADASNVPDVLESDFNKYDDLLISGRKQSESATDAKILVVDENVPDANNLLDDKSDEIQES